MSTRAFLSVFLVLLGAALMPASATAALIHVPADQPTITAGLAAATAGDTVELACGTYYEHDLVVPGGVCLRSETGEADCATIHAQQQGNCLIVDGVSPAVTIEGLTLTQGLGDVDGGAVYCRDAAASFRHCLFTDNVNDAVADRDGLGIHGYNASLSVIDCEFSANFGEDTNGGGIYLAHAPAETAVLAATRCRFADNSVPLGGGGALYFAGRSLTLTECEFTGNVEQGSDGPGAVSCRGDSLIMSDCSFRSNWARFGVGAIGSNCAYNLITRCEFHSNSVPDDGAVGAFALGNDAAAAFFTECTFTHNGALATSALSCNAAAVTLDYCTFAHNSSEDWMNFAGQVVSTSGSLTVSNSIFAFNHYYENGAVIRCGGGGSAWLECCDVAGNSYGDYIRCIAGQFGIRENFTADPLFCNPGEFNYRLNANSPCAAENHPTCGQVGAWPAGCEPVGYLVLADGSGDYPTIQAAIDASTSGDVVELGAGVFQGEGNRDLDYGGRSITVRSQSGNAATCIIDCEGGPGDYHRGVRFRSAETENAVLEKVTIRNGYQFNESGGAILVESGATPVIRGCILEYNSAPSGSAIRTYGPTRIEDCVIRHNGGESSSAVFLVGFDIDSNHVIDCEIIDNEGHGIEITGGGLIEGTLVARNALGYGIYHGNWQELIIERCTLVENEAGGIYARNGLQDLICDRVIIAYSSVGPAIECEEGAEPLVACSDFYANAGGDWVDCVAPLGGELGNFSLDPLFCSLTQGDYGLLEGSPCLPPGNGCNAVIGAYGEGCILTDADEPAAPAALRLAQNHPNPFNPATEIRYSLATASAVSLRIYNVGGRAVRTLLDGAWREAGWQRVEWDGRDEAGHDLASGIYFYSLEAGAERAVRKMTLLR